MDKNLCAIILAAGKGTRMKSDLPKILHILVGKPLVFHVLDLIEGIGIKDIFLVLGHGAHLVEKELANKSLHFIYQDRQLGTGHAVLCCEDYLSNYSGDCLIMCGDTPLFTKETISEFVKGHLKGDFDISILSTVMQNPTGYGRIVRSDKGNVLGIVEEKDASQKERSIKEVNTGCYVVRINVLFDLLHKVDCNNIQGEYYLTDIVALALKKGFRVEAFPLASEQESLGVNSRKHLALAEEIMLSRIRDNLMAQGVTFSLPSTTYIEETVQVGKDVFIGPSCVLKGKSIIGDKAYLSGMCYIKDSVIEDNVKLEPCTVLINKNERR